MSAKEAGIVHLGLGAFHRAHQAVYTQDAALVSDGSWRITGASLHSAGVVDHLNAQNGRYTLVVRSAEGPEYRRMDIHGRAISGAHGLAPIHRALAAPETKIVSLTVTENGYRPDPSGKESPTIQLLVQAMETRRKAGLSPFTFLCCDNLPDNGAALRALVLEAAQRRSSALAHWIAEQARFPSTMVDRITPATTPALLDEVVTATGFPDAIPVETEAFSQWVIEDNFATDRPAWDKAGALLVRDVALYGAMKLRMLNGAQSMLAYMGHVARKPYVRDVMADPNMARLVARYMDAAAASLPHPDTLEPTAYRDDLLVRFANPAIAHATFQIAMDGSEKMPVRVFSAALDAASRGQDLAPFAFATALWANHLSCRRDTGEAFDLQDPRAAELAALPRDPKSRIDALFRLPNLVPAELAARPDFVAMTTDALKRVVENGVQHAVSTEFERPNPRV